MPPTSSNVLCGCGRFMFVKRNGVTVEELQGNGEPYKLWDGDLYECGDCGATVITGFAKSPVVEHWQPEYSRFRLLSEPIYPGRSRD